MKNFIRLQSLLTFKSYLIILLLFLLNACAYYPQTTDIPLIKKKNDLRIDGGFSYSALSGTVSYGLTEKVAVQLAGNFNYQPMGMGFLVNSSIGLYNFNPKNNWSDELYFGVGNGYAIAYNGDYYPGKLEGFYQQYFVQGNIGRRGMKLKFIECAIGLKLGVVNSHFYDRAYSWEVHDSFYYSNTYAENYNFPRYDELSLLFEPTLSIKLGGDKLMFNIKPGYCYILNLLGNMPYPFPYSPYNLGLSLNYRF